MILITIDINYYIDIKGISRNLAELYCMYPIHFIPP